MVTLLKGLEQLRKDNKNSMRYDVQEIDDLLDFVSSKDYEVENKMLTLELESKRQVICWIENHFKKIDNYIEN